MSITYTLESWDEVVDEMKVLWQDHWAEVAMDQATIPLDPDYDLYRELDHSGQLHIVVVRRSGSVIGYHISIIKRHLHYKGTLHGFTDVYFIKPDERKGMVGVRLFKEVERTLRQRGVQKMVTGTKLSLDMSRIFERLGWRETERTFTKYIGD